MTLGDYTSPGMIIPHLSGRDVSTVLKELGQTMQQEGRVPEFLQFYQAALNREYLASTDVEEGIAFPHARVAGLKEVSFSFGRSSEPLSWGSKGQRVRMVFLSAVPSTDSSQYLLMISGLVRLLKDEVWMKKLNDAQDTFQIFNVFQQVPLRPKTESPSLNKIFSEEGTRS